MRASFVLSEIGIGLRRNLTMTIAVIVTTAISLTLFGLGLVARQQANDVKGYWYDKIEVSLFLRADITAAQRSDIGAQLAADPLVAKVYFESKQEAYRHSQEIFVDQPDLAANFDPSSLPESYRVKLKNPRQVDALSAEYSPLTKPGIDQVQDLKKLLQPLFNVLDVFQYTALSIAGFQLLAAIILISNTIRVAAFNRRRETGIMRLVGASNLYIQLPFLLEGALAGLVGAGIAAGAIVVVKSQVIDAYLKKNLGSISGHWVTWGEVGTVLPVVVVVGVALSSMASFVTLRRHLRV